MAETPDDIFRVTMPDNIGNPRYARVYIAPAGTSIKSITQMELNTWYHFDTSIGYWHKSEENKVAGISKGGYIGIPIYASGGVISNGNTISVTWPGEIISAVGTTGGNKVTNVNVADLFEVYPELAPEWYSEGWSDDVQEKREAEQDFAKNLDKAADHLRNKKALKSLPRISKTKEDK